MSYLTPTAFKARAIPSGSFNDLSDDEIQTALDSASAEINAALRPHHTLTSGSLQTPDASIKEAEAIIAGYRLLQFIGRKPNANSSSEEHLQQRYLEIVGDGGYLQRLARGQFILDAAADETSTTREGRSRIVGRKPTSARRFNQAGDEYV